MSCITVTVTVSVALALAWSLPATAASFDFVHVEANAGDAGGGHAAVCLDANCYHYQQDVGGTLRLYRDPRARFELSYRALGNRALNIERVPIAGDRHERLVQAFEEIYRVQSRQFETLDALGEECRLLEFLSGHSQSAPPLPGSGYFIAPSGNPSPKEPTSAEADTFVALLQARYGNAFLDRRARELSAAIDNLRPSPPPRVELPRRGVLPPPAIGFAERYHELVTELLALRVVANGLPLRPDTYLVSDGASFQLDQAESAVLAQQAARLRENLLRLLGSKRPDWGYPLLVGLARLRALELSLASGQLVLLDVFADDNLSIPAERLNGDRAALDLLMAERHEDLEAARAAFFGEPRWNELHFSHLELAGNLLDDLDHSIGEARPLRVPPDGWLPHKAAPLANQPKPQLSEEQWQAALAEARQRQQRYRAELVRLYPYDVVARNCATELLHTLDDGLDSEAAGDGLLAFVPFVAARQIRERYGDATHLRQPSYRELALARLYSQGALLPTYLRESNVVTSRIYRRNPQDSIFLLFTDDVFWPRPFYGAINLAAGVLAAGAGLFSSPFDDGELLGASLNGVLFSIPELGFVSLRKGSFGIAPRRWLAPT